MDSVPIVVITGQVATTAIGTDAFQECPITGVTMDITKHNWLVTDVDDLPRVVAEAFHVATTGRPCPVLIDVPKDISNAQMDWYWPESIDDLDLPGYHPQVNGDPALVAKAVDLILSAERPVIYAGGGILKARASEALRRLAEVTGIPVTTTLMSRGSFPDSHPLALGMPGMHGNYTAVTAMQQADLLIALGSRFDDRVTGKVSAFAPGAKVIHVDIDPAELGKVRRAEVPIVGDCRLVIDAMLECLEARKDELGPPRNLGPWIAQIAEWKARFPLTYDRSPSEGVLKPQYVVECLSDQAPDETIVVAGVGQHQMWASQWWRFERPNTWVNSGGAGTMGRSARRDRCQGRPPGCDRLGDRRRRVLPDDRSGARHRFGRTDPREDRDPEQRLPRNGPSVAGDVLRRAVLRGVPLTRSPRLREVGRGDGLRRAPRRIPRGGPRRDRQGELDRRQTSCHRLPHRRFREGLPDGSRRCLKRRHRGRPEPGPGRAMTAPTVDGTGGAGGPATGDRPGRRRGGFRRRSAGFRRAQAPHRDGPGREQVRVLARVAGLFSRRGYNIFSLAVAPTDDARMSRITIVVDVESAPLEQVINQLDKLINVVSITELAPEEATERELMPRPSRPTRTSVRR